MHSVATAASDSQPISMRGDSRAEPAGVLWCLSLSISVSMPIRSGTMPRRRGGGDVCERARAAGRAAARAIDARRRAMRGHARHAVDPMFVRLYFKDRL
eukprot:SAG31_NODE_2301_length_5978_cov_14.073652_2_plen_99_part_00